MIATTVLFTQRLRIAELTFNRFMRTIYIEQQGNLIGLYR
jgi:hypothetical protein